MSEVNYTVTYRKASLQRYLEKASWGCISRFNYFMAPEVDEWAASEDRERSESKKSRRVRSTSSTVDRKKLRRVNPNFATLEDSIMEQEAKFQATMAKKLKNCAYYPPRPSMKFIPSPVMIHQLLHQTIMVQNANLEAPESFRQTFDAKEPRRRRGKEAKPEVVEEFEVIKNNTRFARNIDEESKAAHHPSEEDQVDMESPTLQERYLS